MPHVGRLAGQLSLFCAAIQFCHEFVRIGDEPKVRAFIGFIDKVAECSARAYVTRNVAKNGDLQSIGDEFVNEFSSDS